MTQSNVTKFNAKVYTRGVISIVLLVTWTLVVLTGFLLWVAPTGQGSGRESLLLGLTKGEWGDIHLWISLAAMVVTILHLFVDRKGLYSCVRYLVKTHRSHAP